VNKPTPIHYFDTGNGALLTGAAAVEQHLEAGGHPADLVELGELLNDRTLQIAPATYGPPEIDDWERDDYLSYGHWLFGVARAVRERIIDRGYQLGLGPTRQRIRHPQRFGSLAMYYEELHAEGAVKRNHYASWSFQRCMSYIEDVGAELEKQATNKHWVQLFKEKASRGEGPSPVTLARLTGHSVSALLDMAGYVDVHTWTGSPERYIDWGVKFMLANDGIAPYFNALRILSPRRRAPGVSSIYAHFDSIPAYKAEVRPAYEAELERRQAEQAQKFQSTMNELAAGRLPVQIIAGVASAEELIKRVAKFRVVDEILPAMHLKSKRDISMLKSTQAFQDNIIKATCSNVTVGEIERVAQELGVFDDIWPMDDYFMTALRVPPPRYRYAR
jgi:hypothetical protein